MDPITLGLLGLGVGGSLASIVAGNSAARKQRKYEKLVDHRQMQDARRNALKSAINDRTDFGTQNLPVRPDTSREQTIQAIGGLAGGVGSSLLGGLHKSTPIEPAMQLTDNPGEAIRRRLQNSFNPYGGDYVG